jgi:hypothetical protein
VERGGRDIHKPIRRYPSERLFKAAKAPLWRNANSVSCALQNGGVRIDKRNLLKTRVLDRPYPTLSKTADSGLNDTHDALLLKGFSICKQRGGFALETAP